MISRRGFLSAAGHAALAAGLADLAAAPARAAAAEGAPPPDERRIVVLTARPRQTMAHFGASACWTLEPIGRAFAEDEKERIAELLFSQTKGVGLSLLRFNFGAGDPKPDGYWHPWRRVECFQDAPGGAVDGTRQAGQQWFLKAAKRHGVEKTLAFVCSPPAWLTKNGRAFCDRTAGATNLKAGAEGAFAAYLADVLLDFERRGLPFDYVSPVNEPNWDWNGGQEGCRYGNGDLARLLPVVAKALRDRKVRAEMAAVESGDIVSLLDDDVYRAARAISGPAANATGGRAVPGKRREYLRDLLGDPAVRDALGGRFLAHSYWTAGSWHDRSVLRAALRENLRRYAPKPEYWQSEFCFMEHGRDLGMDTALRLAALVHADLTAAEASSWSWWLAVSDADYKDGLIYTDFGPKGGANTVLPSKTLWALGHWSRFVRPGARRVEIATDALPMELLASAFVDAPGRRLTMVVVNAGETPRTVRLAADRALGPLTPCLTDAAHDLAPCPAADPKSSFALPPRSIVTFVADLGPAADSPPAAILPSPPKRERANDGPAADLYAVHCGASGDAPAASDARRNALADQPCGADPGTGFVWGYTTCGPAGSRADGDGTVRWDDGDTAGQGIVYRFEVPPNAALTVEVTFRDPWNNTARRMDVLVQGKAVETGLVPGADAVTRRYSTTASGDGTLTVAVVRSAGSANPAADPVVSEIRVRPAA